MAEQDPASEIARQMSEAMRDWRTIMDQEHQLSVRIGRRTTQIIRFTMVLMVLVCVVMGGLVVVLTRDMGLMTVQIVDMAGYMNTMQANFVTVAARMSEMQETMSRLDGNISPVPQMAQSVGHMSADMGRMSADVGRMATAVDRMSGDLSSMINEMRAINGNMYGMTSNMRHMSRPLDFFPF
ncbi:MAG: hypothetical protein H7840_05795 [Alphaproteobacteria bacterium]